MEHLGRCRELVPGTAINIGSRKRVLHGLSANVRGLNVRHISPTRGENQRDSRGHLPPAWSSLYKIAGVSLLDLKSELLK